MSAVPRLMDRAWLTAPVLRSKPARAAGLLAPVAVLGLAGCSALTDFAAFSFGDAAAPWPDARPADAGPRADGALDAGLDGARPDAGPPPPDAGSPPADAALDAPAPGDAGTAEAGSPDTGRVEGGTACGGCTIGATCVTAGAPDPSDPCKVCDPIRNRAGWSPKVCEADALGCTDARCGPSGCEQVLRADSCLIGGGCVGLGARISETCQACVPSSDPHGWTTLDSGPCDDGSSCTSGDTCQADGACRGTLDPGYCLIDDVCRPAGTLPGGCRECDPARSTSTSFPLPDGTACIAGASPGICCSSGCFLRGSTLHCGSCGNTCSGAEICCPVASRLRCSDPMGCD